MPTVLAMPLALLFCAAVAGCGNKGDLYLTDSEALEQSLDDVDRRLQELSNPGSSSVDDALDDIEAEEAAEEAADAASEADLDESLEDEEARKREQTGKTR